MNQRFYPLLLLLTALAFFFPFLGSVHLFDWDEINFAESAREMIVTGNYSRVMIDFQPFWEKPPLFFWMQSLCMNLIGINEYAARLPNAIMGMLTLLTLYYVGKRELNAKFGLIWALAYAGSFLPHLYFKSGIIDPTFNYFIFLGTYLVYRWLVAESSRLLFPLAAGCCIGIATLTKGPVALLVVLLTVTILLALKRIRLKQPLMSIAGFLLAFAVISSLWFGVEVLKNGPWFIKEFLNYQVALFSTGVAGHEEPFYYHFIVVFAGCFPMSVLALPYVLRRNFDNGFPLTFSRIMQILFWVVMILFSIVKTKIVHYSSLSYFPLSYLAACTVYMVTQQKLQLKKTIWVLLSVMGYLFGLLLIALPLLLMNKEHLIPFIHDEFATACLRSNVPWSGYEVIPGIIYLVLLTRALMLIRYQNRLRGFVFLFYSTMICMFFYLKTVIPKIEEYSQGPEIRFYRQLQEQDVYAEPIGFKSYAQYYYFNKMPWQVNAAATDDWLLSGDIDKPAYLVTKINRKKRFDVLPDVRLLGAEGGYLFYLREKK